MKTIQTGDVVQSFESDTVNWQKELSVFLTWNLNRAGREAEYLVTTDSSGSLSITRYTARDSNLVLRDVAITRRDGKTELLVLETVSRSWVRDRTVRFSYQPGKGYGIHQTENTLWGSPQTMEIFAEIQDEAHLKK
ncbi:MAG: hypothetical protein JNL57_12315 [Bacteroidetes bacterium]|nr:hypothetical protein [Bacteroidota bacterium]